MYLCMCDILPRFFVPNGEHSIRPGGTESVSGVERNGIHAEYVPRILISASMHTYIYILKNQITRSSNHSNITTHLWHLKTKFSLLGLWIWVVSVHWISVSSFSLVIHIHTVHTWGNIMLLHSILDKLQWHEMVEYLYGIGRPGEISTPSHIHTNGYGINENAICCIYAN